MELRKTSQYETWQIVVPKIKSNPHVKINDNVVKHNIIVNIGFYNEIVLDYL